METIGGDLTTMPFQPLSAEHVEILRRLGRERRFAAGEMVAEAGEPQDRLWFVEEGEIELVDPLTDKRKHPTSLGPNQFTGEIAFLSGGSFTLPLRAAKDTRAIEVEREPGDVGNEVGLYEMALRAERRPGERERRGARRDAPRGVRRPARGGGARTGPPVIDRVPILRGC